MNMPDIFKDILRLIQDGDLVVSNHGYDELKEKTMKKRRSTKLIHEGRYVAEVDIDLLDSKDGWSPYLSLEDALKLDDVRAALRRGDLENAALLSKVFTLTPVSV